MNYLARKGKYYKISSGQKTKISLAEYTAAMESRKDGKERSSDSETWSSRLQQTKAYSESPSEVSRSPSKGWFSSENDSVWAAGSKGQPEEKE